MENKYYQYFINKNKKLIDLITNEMLIENSYDNFINKKIKNKKIKFNIDENQNIEINISERTISAVVNLKTISAEIFWTYPEKINNNPKSFFRKPTVIEFWKRDPETELYFEDSKIYLRPEITKLEFKYRYIENTPTSSNRYRISFDKDFNTEETDYNKNHCKDNEAEKKFQILRIIKYIPLQAEVLLDFLVLGKKIPKETSDLIMLLTDLKVECFSIKDLSNINDFNSEIKIFNEKKIKNKGIENDKSRI